MVPSPNPAAWDVGGAALLCRWGTRPDCKSYYGSGARISGLQLGFNAQEHTAARLLSFALDSVPCVLELSEISVTRAGEFCQASEEPACTVAFQAFSYPRVFLILTSSVAQPQSRRERVLFVTTVEIHTKY